MVQATNLNSNITRLNNKVKKKEPSTNITSQLTSHIDNIAQSNENVKLSTIFYEKNVNNTQELGRNKLKISQ